jgi:hypothetical protein
MKETIMKKYFLALLIITALYSRAFSIVTETYDNSSSVSARYLYMGSGAAAAGMGNAYIGVVSDASSIFWNPAGLAEMQRDNRNWNLYFTQDIWFQDEKVSEAAIAASFKKLGTFALGVSYYNAGAIQRADIDQNYNGILRDGTFAPYSVVINAAYAAMMDEGIDFGINLKYLIDIIDDDMAQALAFDAAVRYHFPFLRNLSVNVVAKNFGGRLNTSTLSKEMDFGAAYNFDIGDFKLTADYDICGRVSNDPVQRAGIVVKTPYLVVLRAGYQSDNTTIDSGFKNFTFGAGMNISDKYVDFAFEPYGDIGNAYKVSFGGDF